MKGKFQTKMNHKIDQINDLVSMPNYNVKELNVAERLPFHYRICHSERNKKWRFKNRLYIIGLNIIYQNGTASTPLQILILTVSHWRECPKGEGGLLIWLMLLQNPPPSTR